MDFHSPIISLSIQSVNSIPQDLSFYTIYIHHISLVVLAANLKNGPYIGYPIYAIMNQESDHADYCDLMKSVPGPGRSTSSG